MSAPHTASASCTVRGMRVTDHRFTVPLDHADPDGETITVFAREYTDAELPQAEAERLPWLLYLQGGPGGKGPRLLQFGGWTKAASSRFRLLMLDQRGTGLSTPLTRQTLAVRGNAAAQAEFLAHFRADSIVADAELIREALGSAPWTTYGQSYGGFCTLTYLSFAPHGLRESLITGGLAPLTGPADRVYRATFRRVAARNAEYFAKYPQDRTITTRIARHLKDVPEFLPSGERLSVQRFQMAGSYLGGNTRMDGLHHLLEEAFVSTPDGDRLSDTFLETVHGLVSRAANPLYALLHESIYGQGKATDWAAERVLEDFPEFRPDAEEPLYTGEMVYPWYFDEDPALVPLKDTAELLAARKDWPALYDPAQLARNTVPVAAAVYSDDIYVDRDLSLETAAAVRGLRVWESPDFHHDGIADDGEGIFNRLLAMVRGEPEHQEAAEAAAASGA
ncbi:alpha/beta fold hydrolase [Arthrobacter sp. zg-Y820]|uniref:alpha/beta fold hydrolase n=1 Tax=unclassified Arthrobacter TaxID=235627 RepID=UPI001E2EEBB9|nr:MULTISPECIES: alpha/beta fold hydrolase [unclassified Arthrobacter]MCC9196593.1 alpha/beta hydrolase [Arthrobacter sp. zg-Y820]MDK1279455.1 alpha/beta fold hydrolase [Arthrobacter sp. zg.Y820]WIB08166.1 alpha/beta fold hydrolase [Arthrobacter sp. zg-Y820]